MLKVIHGLGEPRSVAVSPDGQTVYVTATDSGAVAVINAANDTVTRTIKVGELPWQVVVSPKENSIPFYVAAPISTVDLACANGDMIPIEQRNAKEVTHIAGKQMVPDGVSVENPAFDVTPAKYVSAIITERGIAREPYQESLERLAAVESKVEV